MGARWARSGRSYAPAIKTPEIRVTHRREGLSVISTVANRGKVRRKAFAGAMNAITAAVLPVRDNDRYG
ncbi:hypothetical protein GWK36_07115 [Caldichromatium japonicum]|uniref:Uncharacterized protein n=1 Tax=Caldichromatium japonicum TaxID=2699430 RepID=A0A6G7VCP4_9GAMM|nr:hypothetical protein [Caldichromatium japonicum]QIK37791.1 hypothetical protein GWK36_07115 [Caldichromatium japonicum]